MAHGWPLWALLYYHYFNVFSKFTKKMIQNIFLGEYEKITLLKLQKKLLIKGGSEAMYRENKGMSYHNEPRMAKAKAVLVSVVIAFD